MDNKNGNRLLHSLNTRLAEQPQKISEARQNGKKVIGYFCPYGAEELILAADLIPVRLVFAGDIESVSTGREFLKSHSCPYVCSAIGYKKLSTNDYFNALDGVCIPQTYDSMKVLADYWQKYFKIPVFSLGIPRTHNKFRTKPHAIEYFKNELDLLKMRLGEFSGKKVTDLRN
jgi:benzoyl-CoA reductase/2-hydroxyglutaryl-CoA dehydratase subunit BcrC/BadD/HgdB